MKLAVLFLLSAVVVSVLVAQNPPKPMKPPVEWSGDARHYQSIVDKLQKAQLKFNAKHQKEIDLANGIQQRLKGSIPVGMEYDSALDLWVPSVVVTPPPPSAPPKVEGDKK